MGTHRALSCYDGSLRSDARLCARQKITSYSFRSAKSVSAASIVMQYRVVLWLLAVNQLHHCYHQAKSK